MSFFRLKVNIFIFLHIFQLHAASNVLKIGGVFATLDGNKPNIPSIHRKAGFLLAIDDIEKQYQKYNLDIQISVQNIKSDFLNAIDSARNMMTSFDNQGVHGCIGAAVPVVTAGLAAVFNITHTAQVAFGPFDSLLTHTNYQSFLAAYGNDASQGSIIAHILVNYYKYKRIVVVYTTNIYGIDNYNEFNAVMLQNDLGILEEMKLIPNDHDIEKKIKEFIDNVLPYEPRIFVLLLDNATQAATFINVAIHENLLNGNSFTWGTQEITNHDLIKALTKVIAKGDARQILKEIRYMGLSHASTDWKYTKTGNQFIKKIQAQNSTLTSKKMK